MILYYGVTQYHFLCFLVDKLLRHKTEVADLLIPARINFSEYLVDSLKRLKIFRNVIQYQEYFPKEGQTIDKITEETFRLVESYPINLDEYREINVACDHYSFGVYLNINKIKYNFWEDGRGRLCTDNILLEHLKKINISRFNLIKKFNLLGHSECVVKRFGDLNSIEYINSEGKDNRDVNFSLIAGLKELDNRWIEKICFAFNLDTNIVDSINRENTKSTILITQHYLNLGILTRKSQIDLYLAIVDYFAIGNLYIKIHPSDIQIPYLNYFKEAKIISPFCPSELISILCNENVFSRAISVSSTSIDVFRNCSKEVIVFDQQLEKDIYKIDKYYVLSEFIKANRTGEVSAIGLNLRLFNNFGNIEIKSLAQDIETLIYIKGDILIVGELVGDSYGFIKRLIDKCRDNWNKIVFTDLVEKGAFVNNHNLAWLKRFSSIEIKTIKEFEIDRYEYIYIYTEDPYNISPIKLEKKLNFSNKRIVVDMRYDQDIQALRGINKALEERLRAVTKSYKDLLAENKSLREQICTEDQKKQTYTSSKLEDLFVKLTTSKKKYEKYKKNRDQYLNDGWLYKWIFGRR